MGKWMGVRRWKTFLPVRSSKKYYYELEKMLYRRRKSN